MAASTHTDSTARRKAIPSTTPTPAEAVAEKAVRAEIRAVHARCVHEPHAGLQAALAYQQSLATRTDLAQAWLPILHGALENALAAAEHRMSRPREAEGRVQRVAEALRKNTWMHATPDWLEEHDQVLASALRLLAVVLDDQGRHAEALPWHREAIATYERLGDRLNQGRQWHNISILFARTMLFSQALEAMKRSAELLDGLEDPGRFREFATWTHEADVLYEMGDDVGAEAAARRAIEATSTPGHVFERGEPHAALGAALLRQGRIDEAVAALKEASRRLEKHGHRIGQAKVLSGLARAAAPRDTDGARSLMLRAIALAREAGAETDAAGYLAWLARSHLECHEPIPAAEIARDGLARLPEMPGVDPAELELRLILADALAAVGETPGALREYRTYHERFAAAHDARKTLQAQILAAEYQVELSRRDAARARLENARLNEALAEIAARLDGRPSTITRVGIDSATPESFRPLGLRPRECEVLHWVVQGKSNDEIAVILNCSAETVKSHLKRIYTQLDVTNRASATAKALSVAAPRQ